VIYRRSFIKLVIPVVLSGLLSFALPTVRAVETLPSELSDAAFWKMITDFSEEGGTFPSENFLSNESGYQHVIPSLKAVAKPGGVYLGVGPEQNFTYIASLQPKIAFIVDIRRQNMIQHLMYKAAFELSADRAEFLSRLFSRRRPEGLTAKSSAQQLFDAYRLVGAEPDIATENLRLIREVLTEKHKFELTVDDEQTLSHVFNVFARYGPDLSYSSNIAMGIIVPGRAMPTYAELMLLDDGQGMNRSYLADDDSFRLLKEMQAKNLIVPLVGNFGGPKAVRAVGEYLRARDATVAAFYVSNVEQYLFMEQISGKFYENVATLPVNASSMFIRTTNGRNLPTSSIGARDFQSILGSIMDSIQAFREGSIQNYVDLLQIPVH
jgi:hypothetical protein